MNSYAIATCLSKIMAQEHAMSLTADDGGGGNKLQVMNDGDGARLLMDIYTNYVSEFNFSNFPAFMQDVDSLLFKARGNKPFTHEDRAAAEEDAPAPRKKSGKKRRPSPSPSPAPAADNADDSAGSSVTASAIARSLTASLSLAA